MTPQLLTWNLALIVILMSVLWVVSVRLRNVSIVDPWWSIAFLLVTAHTSIRTGLTPAKLLLLGMVTVWALRLWLHLLLRSRGKPEDPRYAAFRRRYGVDRYWWFSFFQVFLLQGVLAFLISMPLQLAGADEPPDPITPWDLVGAFVVACGFALEAVADWQLESFRRDPTRRGGVLDTGLWRTSRHPNYFGEAVLQWGFWICVLDQAWGWLAVLAPLVMTYLLVKVSGAAMMNAHLKATRPEFAAYAARTSPFIPLPPRADRRWRA